MTDAAPVNVTLEQINRKGHHLPRGSFKVNGRPGSNAVLFKGRVPQQEAPQARQLPLHRHRRDRRRARCHSRAAQLHRPAQAPSIDGHRLSASTWPNAASTGSSASSASTRSSRPPTATSARRSTTPSGLVASFALGLTPVVFIITGFIFYLTAATYAEATAMYPEAGGSSSFARHAFNEFWSFFAAWAQMLNYMITIAISAFFVPHYLGGLFWDALRHPPGRHHLRHRRDRAAVRAQHRRRRRSRPGSTSCWRSPTSRPSCCSCSSASFLVFSPQTLVDNVHLGVAPTWKDFFLAIPVGDDRLHGHRDDLEHGRGGQGRDEDDPRGDQARRHRRVRDLRAAAGGRAERAAGRPRTPTASYQTLLGLPEEPGRLRRRPDPRRRQADRPRRRCRAPPRSTSACSPRRSCSSPPTRGSSASRGSSTRWACTARCPTGCASCTRSTARRGSGSSSSARSPA